MTKMTKMNQHLDSSNGDYVVFYHGWCADGLTSAAVFASAYALSGTLREGCRPITFVPYDYGDPVDLSIITKQTTVYLLDVCVTDLDLLQNMCGRAASVVSLDHHESGTRFCVRNAAKLPSNFVNLNSEERCGAFLTFRHIFPDARVPRIVELVDDRDRWQFNYNPDTEAFHEYVVANILSISDLNDKIKTMSDLILSDRAFLGALSVGKHLVKYRNALIKSILTTVQFGKYEHTDGKVYKYGYVQVPYELLSETCSQMMKLHPSIDFSMGSQQQPNGDVKFGLRARAGDVRVPVNQIAERFGGGGHREAAGLYANEIDSKIARDFMIDNDCCGDYVTTENKE